jgi:hypothetical protein
VCWLHARANPNCIHKTSFTKLAQSSDFVGVADWLSVELGAWFDQADFPASNPCSAQSADIESKGINSPLIPSLNFLYSFLKPVPRLSDQFSKQLPNNHLFFIFSKFQLHPSISKWILVAAPVALPAVAANAV